VKRSILMSSLALLAGALPIAALLGAVACGPQTPAAAPPAPAVAAPAPDRSGLPQPGPRGEWAPPAPAEWQLKSGNRVLYLHQGEVPLVSVALVFPRGAETDPAERAGLTQLTADLLDEGAGGKTALELSDELQRLATDYRALATTDSLVLSMDLIADNFAESVKLLADIVRRPKLDRAEFNRRKAQAVAQALAAESEPGSGRRVALQRALFGKGYAGQVATGTRRTLETISYEDVSKHYQKLIVAEGAQFAVSGGIDRAIVERELESAFGDWSGKAGVEARALSPEPATPAIYFVNYPGAAQSSLGVARRAPGFDADDYFPAAIFNRGFGESFVSRVNMNLREDKGYTYGSFSTFARFKKAGLFGIFAEVKTDKTRASIDEIVNELGAVCAARPVSTAERDDSVNGLLLGYPARFESSGLAARALSDIIREGRPLDWFEQWPKRIEAVTVDAANLAAKSYCDAKQFSIAIAGDRATVAPTLEGLGLKVVYLDAQGDPAP
jgi:zinc protease